jgi:hypothetical protein
MFYKANVRHFLGIKKQFTDKYNMRRIKTFSALNESASDTVTFQTTLGGYSSKNVGTMVEIYGEPKEIYNCSVIGGKAEWTLDIEYNRWGIDIGPMGARIASMLLVLEIENEETGDYEEMEIEVEESQIDTEFLKTEIHEFPLGLESMEIEMKQSMNPSDWHITLHVGQIR